MTSETFEPRRVVVSDLPRSDEGFRGYLQRVSELNGFPTLRWVYRRTHHLLESFRSTSALAALATTTRINLEQLLPIAHLRRPDGVAGRVSFLSAEAYPGFMHDETSKICPACLAESGYARAVWDLSYVLACPRHGCRLVAQCPGCGEPISSRRGRLTRCGRKPRKPRRAAGPEGPRRNRCVCDLRTAPLIPARPAMVWLSAAIGAAAGRAAAVSPVKRFEDLELDDMLKLIRFIGTHGLPLDSNRNRLGNFRSSASSTEALTTVAADAFYEWPANFGAYLDVVRANHAVASGENLRSGLSSFYQYATVHLYRDSHHFFLKELAYLLQTRWLSEGLSTRSRKMLKLLDEDDRLLSGVEAEALLGCSRERLNEYLAAGKLKGAMVRSGGRNTIYVDRESAILLRAQQTETLTREATCERLAVSWDCVLDLIACGALDVVRRSAGMGDPWELASAAVDGLLERLGAGCSRTTLLSKPRPGTRTLRHAVRYLPGRKTWLAPMIERILSGDIKCVGRLRGAEGFGSLLFKESELAAAAAEAHGKASPTLTLRQAARVLRCKRAVVYRLARAGVLETMPHPRGVKGARAVSAAALETFRERFATGADIAAELGVATRVLQRGLAAVGVKPAVPSEANDRGDKTFYPRLAVNKAVKTGSLSPYLTSACNRKRELSGREWKQIATALRYQKYDGAVRGANARSQIEGILWMLRRGKRWKDLPDRYGAGPSLQSLYSRWRKTGVWDKVVDVLTTSRGRGAMAAITAGKRWGPRDNATLRQISAVVERNRPAEAGGCNPRDDMAT